MQEKLEKYQFLSRGNVIKPKEATTEPYVHYECPESDSFWTLLLTNPDGHFTDNSSEYLHWMVSNIKGNDLSTGQVIAPYLQPFPAFGTGYHRYVFVLFKQVNLLEFLTFPAFCVRLYTCVTSLI